MRAAIKPSFAALTSVHCHFCRFESKLSASENANVQSLREGLMSIYEKKHSILLCFLVAGRRIELRTS